MKLDQIEPIEREYG